MYHQMHCAGSACSYRRTSSSTWGDRGVLILIGIRLGLDGVNPIYYDTIKVPLSTFLSSNPRSSYLLRNFTPGPNPSASPAVALRPPITSSAPKPTLCSTSTRTMRGPPSPSARRPR
jgi:hypothetical protein